MLKAHVKKGGAGDGDEAEAYEDEDPEIIF